MIRIALPRVVCRLVAFLVATLMLTAPLPAAGLCGGRSLFDDPARPTLAAEVARFTETTNADATFWRIDRTDGSVAPSYLLGTIHLTDERITTLPPPVAKALDGARILAVENRAAMQTEQDGATMQTFM
ncbi:TraB/GumN family protein, partial [Mycobacterium tuberculosis]|nr:TraB/GumN family protein [Mycobacterium tuberculosis]